MTNYEMRKIADMAAQRVVEILKAEKILSSDRTLRASEAAELMGVSRKTVYNLRNKGELPCRKVGHTLLFSEYEILNYLHK